MSGFLSLTKLRGWLVVFAHKVTDRTAEVLSEDPERVPGVSWNMRIISGDTTLPPLQFSVTM